MKLYPILTLCLSIFLTPVASAKSTQVSTEEQFQIWLANFKQQAIKAGIPDKVIKQAFKGVHLNRKILKLDHKQPEFTHTFFEYFDRAVSKKRIKTGRVALNKYKKILTEVTKKYGVPGRFIIAFWGIETNYGSYTGNSPIIESLATLAFDPRRSEFFSNQLVNALQIINLGYVNAKQMKGSWAGAMGQCQFMPSNYLKYAVDGDGDGKINLWDSLPDVFYSAGNFLQHLGWKAKQTWGREVILPKNFDYTLADGKTSMSLQAWHNLGITKPNSLAIPQSTDIHARLILLGDYRGPTFLVYHNFKVIKRWNNSDKYALAVAHLADRIIHAPKLSKKRPKNDKALSRKQVIQIQTYLNSLGYPTGKPDGILGSKTYGAIRDFQTKHSLIADGYPSLRIFKLLKQMIES